MLNTDHTQLLSHLSILLYKFVLSSELQLFPIFQESDFSTFVIYGWAAGVAQWYLQFVPSTARNEWKSKLHISELRGQSYGSQCTSIILVKTKYTLKSEDNQYNQDTSFTSVESTNALRNTMVWISLPKETWSEAWSPKSHYWEVLEHRGGGD
jgi:hypothetical protein